MMMRAENEIINQLQRLMAYFIICAVFISCVFQLRSVLFGFTSNVAKLLQSQTMDVIKEQLFKSS